MKKLLLLSTMLLALPVVTMAQDDDLYFVPTKETKVKEANTFGMPRNTYYCGSKRDAREYNRRAWSYVTPIDSTGMVIDSLALTAADSVFSTEQDYKYTRQMSRFDGYTPSEVYDEGYRDGMRDWSWRSPFGWRYAGWYDPWYDPWYYDYAYWGSPYYYSSSWFYPHYGWGWGWNRPYYGWGWGWNGYYPGGIVTRPSGSNRYWSRDGVTHHRYAQNGRDTSAGNLGGYRSRTYTNTNSQRRNNTTNSDYGSYRSRSYSSPGNSGSSYSGGSYGGGGRSTGGGRSVGGGHNYGGRR